MSETGFIACEVCGGRATVSVSSFLDPVTHWYCANCEPSGPVRPMPKEETPDA